MKERVWVNVSQHWRQESSGSLSLKSGGLTACRHESLCCISAATWEGGQMDMFVKLYSTGGEKRRVGDKWASCRKSREIREVEKKWQ